MSRRDVPGITYLAHLIPALKHARHYVGFAEGTEADLAARLAQHGTTAGARILAAQRAAGGTWEITRTWPGTTRVFERHLKDTRSVPNYCPTCQPQIAAERRQARAASRERGDQQMTQQQTEAGHWQRIGKSMGELAPDSPDAASVLAAIDAGERPDADAIWRAGIAAGLGGERARQLYLEPEAGA